MREELLKESSVLKEMLLKEIELRGIDIEFDDIDKSVNHLVGLKVIMGYSTIKVINDFIEYYLENYEE